LRLLEAGIEPSVGSRDDSYDDTLAETVIGFFEPGVIRQRGPWRGFDDVEFAAPEWVWWFNHQRLLKPLGSLPPAEFKAQFLASQVTRSLRQRLRNELSDRLGAIQIAS
jgi:transposase InsO family protein